jgi:hypothetical protein
MNQHFNLAKNLVVDPFDGVIYVRIATGATIEPTLRNLLNKSSHAVATFTNGEWTLNYTFDCLNFVTLITWLEPYRGKFTIQTHYGQKSVHFRIDSNAMICW